MALRSTNYATKVKTLEKQLAFAVEAQRGLRGVTEQSWESFAKQVSIRSSGGIVKFNPYQFQIDLVDDIEYCRNTLVIKSRQLGISETVCCYLLWRCLKEPGFQAICISKTQSDSGDLSSRIQRMALSLGSACPPMVNESRTEVKFDNQSGIKFLPGTARSARGVASCSVLFFDEASYIERIEDIYQASAPTLAMVPDSKIIMVSTPAGKSGLFYETYLEAIAPGSTSSFGVAALHWSLHPVYNCDPNWRQKTMESQKLTETQWQTEYELSFDESIRNVFREELVRRAGRGCYQGYISGDHYQMGIDSAYGGADNYVALVFNVSRTPYQLVAEYKARKTSSATNIAKTINLINQYNVRQINIETNAGGSLFADEIVKRVPNRKVEGFVTTRQSKINFVDNIIRLLEADQLVYPRESELYNELLFFQRLENGSMSAPSGRHDDMVASLWTCFANLEELQPVKLGTVSWW